MNSPKPPLSSSTRDLRPLPESPEAKASGCTCVVLRNLKGQAMRDRNEGLLYAISDDCPVHR